MMRRAFLLALLMLPGACGLLGPDGQRFVVFFPDSGTALDGSAMQVVAAASDYALAHPEKPVLIAGFADPAGTPAENAAIIRGRTEAVVKAMTAHGIAPARLATRDAGQVEFALSDQESRRVLIRVGVP